MQETLEPQNEAIYLNSGHTTELINVLGTGSLPQRNILSEGGNICARFSVQELTKLCKTENILVVILDILTKQLGQFESPSGRLKQIEDKLDDPRVREAMKRSFFRFNSDLLKMTQVLAAITKFSNQLPKTLSSSPEVKLKLAALLTQIQKIKTYTETDNSARLAKIKAVLDQEQSS